MIDAKKAHRFNTKMGKVKHMARRKYFDTGGIATNQVVGGDNATGATNNTGAGGLNNNGVANLIGVGNNFKAGDANIQSGTNQAQLQNAYTGANNAINAQIGLTNTVNPQAATAVGNQNTLAAQELAMTKGQGPNPALAQLAQTTNTNVNNQAALMAGQRGGSANPALLAREAAMQGANTQQQAVGQAATEAAGQQIAAQQNLSNLAANQLNQTGQAIGNLSSAQQNEQNILQGANTAYNNAAVGMQSNENNVNAQTAAANQSANKGLIGSIAGAIPGLSSMFEKGGQVKDEHLMLAEMNAHSMNHAKKFADGGPVQSNMGASSFAPIQSESGAPSVAATPAFGAPDKDADKAFSDNLGKLGSAVGAKIKDAQDMNALDQMSDAGFLDSEPANASLGGGIGGMMAMYTGGEACPGPTCSHVANYLAGGGRVVKAMVSPGEVSLTPEQVQEVKSGANPLKIGEKIHGKAKVKGDSLKNDVVPKDLEVGGVIVDREHVGDPKKARKFVLNSVSKKTKHMKKPSGVK